MSNCNEYHCDDGNGEEFFGDECEKKLLGGSSNCVQCRKPSSSSSILSHDGRTSTWADETRGSVNMEELNGNVMIPSVMFPQARASLDAIDSFEIPLLDQYTNVPSQNGHVACPKDHCHSQAFSSEKNLGPWRQLIAASVICLIFMMAEIFGGYLAGSTAVMTDAAHLLSDLVGFLVSMFAIWVGKRPPTKRLSFGYYRAEVLGALLSVGIIWMLTGIFIYLAILRLLYRDFKIEAGTMMIVAGIGVVVNIVMGLVLHGICTSVAHGHSHSGAQHMHSHLSAPYEQQKRSNTPGNINLRAAVIHVIGDLIQSVGVFIAAIIIKCYPSAKLADPICTFVFSLMMLFTTISVLRDTVNVLMEGFPKHYDYASISKILGSIEGVRSVHNLHVWSLTLDKCALAVHLAINNSADSDMVLGKALELIKSKLNIDITTVQVERYLAYAMEDCVQCKPPID